MRGGEVGGSGTALVCVWGRKGDVGGEEVGIYVVGGWYLERNFHSVEHSTTPPSPNTRTPPPNPTSLISIAPPSAPAPLPLYIHI